MIYEGCDERPGPVFASVNCRPRGDAYRRMLFKLRQYLSVRYWLAAKENPGLVLQVVDTPDAPYTPHTSSLTMRALPIVVCKVVHQLIMVLSS